MSATPPPGLIELLARLLDPETRTSASGELAATLGVAEVLFFTPDDEIGILLPAPGFLQTLPAGGAWRSFLAECPNNRRLEAELPSPTSGQQECALGIMRGDTLLVLLGGAPRFEPLCEITELLPMLGAGLRAERAAATARGKYLIESEAARRFGELTRALDIVRQDIHLALQNEKQRTQQLHRLAEVATRIGAARDTDSALRVVTEEARQLIGAHQAITSFSIDQNPAQTVNNVSCSDKYATLRGEGAARVDPEILSAVCRTNRPMRLTQAELEARAGYEGAGEQSDEQPPSRGWLAAPLMTREGRNLGLIQLSDKHQADFTAEDEAILVQLAQMGSTALENGRLYDELRSADHRKDEFLATLAHELRNPLAPMRSALELMKQGGRNEVTAEYGQAILERQVAQMVRLIDDLLDVSRITLRKLELRFEPVELTAVIQSAVESSRPLIDAQRHELTVTLPARPVHLNADAMRLAQVFSNLLNNAAKYTERGGRICIDAGTEGDHVLVSIKDTGIGIAEAQLGRVFEMFAQAGDSVGRALGGLGIGLNLAKRLVEKHSGTISVVSGGSGQGSEFIVQLPVMHPVQAGDEAPPRALAADVAVARESRVLRILVADDNRDAAESLSTLLQMEGHEVNTVFDGESAVQASADFRPHVALLDVGMPKLSGDAAARRIRDQSGANSVLLVALTGWSPGELDKRTDTRVFDAHLTKPVDYGSVQRLLRDAPRG